MTTQAANDTRKTLLENKAATGAGMALVGLFVAGSVWRRRAKRSAAR